MKYFLIFALLPTIFVVQVRAEGFSLQELINHAKEHHPQVEMNRWQIEKASLDKERVDGEFGPKLKARVGVGPITETSGNALTSEQKRDHFGAAYLGSFEFVWPIYAWGRKSVLSQAAEQGVLAQRSESEDNFLKVIYEIKEAYYGFLFAKTMVDFIEGHQGKLTEIIESQKAKSKKTELYKTQILAAQIEGKKAEAEAALETAKMGLAVRSGHSLAQTIELKEEWLSFEKREKKPLAHYLDLAKQHPKFNQLKAGIDANDRLAKSEELSRYPVLAFISKYDYADSKVREDQQSVYAYDPFNQNQLMVGVGLEWNFAFGLHSTRRDKYLAEKAKLSSQMSYANQGLLGLVQKSWIELVRAEKRLDASREANKLAKKLWNRSALSWASGLLDSQKISESFTTRALATKDYYEAIYAYELAWAQISQAVGREVDPALISQ